MTLGTFLISVCAFLWCFELGFCASRYSGRDRIVLFNNDIFFGASKMPNRYNFRYLTDGRQYREEAGYTVRRGVESIMKVRGKFYYTGDDGRVYETIYEADENGYRPVSRIVGGAKYPYPERFPAPLPDIPLQPIDDDFPDLSPFGTEYGRRKPNINRAKIPHRPRPLFKSTKTTSTTTPFPEESEDNDDTQNQNDEGEDYDYQISGGAGGEKRDTKNQDNNSKEIEPSADPSSTDSYATPLNHDVDFPKESTQTDSESPSIAFQPPVNEHKSDQHKNQNRKKTQSVTVDRSDDFLESLFGS